MATYTRGTVGTEDINSARIVKDMSEKILLLDPERAPFLVFTSKKKKKKPAHNMKYYWQEDEVMGYRTTIATGEVVTLTADTESGPIEVSNPDVFTVGDMVLIEDSGVVAYVSGVEGTAGTNHITIIPGFDESATAVDIAGDEEIQVIGNANEEGGGPRAENRRQIEDMWNYLQQFKLDFSMTDIQQATKTYGDKSDWAYLRYKKGIQFKEEIERAMWFSGAKKIILPGDDNPTWTTRGIFNSISTNIETIGSTTALTETTWNEFLKDKGFAHGSSKKTLFASRTLAHQISTWAQDSVRTKVGKGKKYGIHVDTYISTLGYELDVVVNEHFTGTKYGQCGVILDMDKVGIRYLNGNGKNFDIKLLVDIIKDGVHKDTDEYFAVLGAQIEQEKCHAAIFNTLDNS